MQKNTTKKAFLLSIASMLLCLSMLVGSTFAWFTDTVTSGVNRIIAGNLDIEVKFSKDGTIWENLDGSSSMFSSSKWEPGHTEVVYLKVENKGTLAFNYKMNVTPISETGGINVAGESFKLSDYLVFKTTDPSDTLTLLNRDSARLTAGTTRKLNQTDLTKIGSMTAGANAQYIALIVYMPDDVGNEANHKPGTTAPQIELSINFVATQKTAESDSFDNNYDDGAVTEVDEYVVGPTYAYFPQVKQTAAITKDGSNVTTGDSNVTIDSNKVTISSSAKVEGTTDSAVVLVIPKEALENGASNPGIEVVKTEATTAAADAAAAANKDIASFNISTIDLPKDGSGKLAAPVTVQLFVGKGLDGVEVFHNGSKMTSGVSYDPATGYVTIESDSFSPFEVLYNKAVARINDTVYRSLKAAFDAVPAGTETTITLISDSTIDVAANPIVVPANKNIVLNLNGYSVIGQCASGTISAMITNRGTLTIKDSSDSSKNGSGTGKLEFKPDPAWVYSESDPGGYASNLIRNEGTLTVDSGYIYNAGNGSATYAIDNYYAGKVTINGGKLDTKKASAIRLFYNDNGELTINGGIIGGTSSYMGVQVMGGTKVIVNLNGGVYGGQYSAYVGTGTDYSQMQFNITKGTFNGEVGFTKDMTNVNISGGTFNAWCGSYGTAKIITGGTFSEDPSDYLVKGYKAVPNNETNPTSWTVTEGIAAVMDGAEYASISDAIAAFNAATEQKAYTITIKNGTYKESDMVIYQDPSLPGKTLHIKAETAKGVTIKPNSDSKTNRVFLISALSSYAGGALTIEGIKFDLSEKNGSAIYLGGGGSGSYDKFITDLIGGPAHRYSHDITVKNCEFVGNNTENSKLIESAQSSSAAGIVIENCVAKDLGYLAEGYFDDYNGKIALTIKGSTVTNAKTLLNNQGGASTTVVENCTVSAYHDYIVRSNGTNIIVRNSSFNSTYAGTATGGIIVGRSSNRNITVENCSFTKSSAAMHDVYNITSASITVNNTTVAAGAVFDFNN